MDVRDVRIEDSPSGAGRVRLIGRVHYDSADAIDEDWWFDVPRRCSSDVSETGNVWLACMLPLAAELGETVRVPLPVDAPLAFNAGRLLRIWRTWYPHLREVPLELEVSETAGAHLPGRGAAFFSGGVDSFFTLLRDRALAPPAERCKVDDLLTVHGFDIPLADVESFERLRVRLAEAAKRLDRDLIDVATNLRTTRWSTAHWSFQAHGAGLASVGLALEKRFSSVLIAGGGGYRGLHPWGSHSVTDPLFSTWRTAVVYDGVAWLRTEKVESIANSAAVHDALHVCYALDSDENCGRCNKCLRTMVTLDVCGVLDQCVTFPSCLDLPAVIARVDCSHFADFREFQDIRRFALERDRPDVVRAIDSSVRRTRRRQVLRKGRHWAAGPIEMVLSRFRRRGP